MPMCIYFLCSETDNCVFQSAKASTISNPADPMTQKSTEPQQLKHRMMTRRNQQKMNEAESSKKQVSL